MYLDNAYKRLKKTNATNMNGVTKDEYFRKKGHLSLKTLQLKVVQSIFCCRKNTYN